MTIYIAGPLFNEAERKFNQDLARKLESLGFNVFLPQRDGVESSKAPYDSMEPDERRKALFELDRAKILECQVFLIVLDGRVPDEGACVELGIAYAQKYLQDKERVIIGLHTDTRSAFLSAKLNPMLKVPLDHLVSSVDELVNFLKKIKQLTHNCKLA
jgi:nucleoside 2-deoxyribosyltransferase